MDYAGALLLDVFDFIGSAQLLPDFVVLFRNIWHGFFSHFLQIVRVSVGTWTIFFLQRDSNRRVLRCNCSCGCTLGLAFGAVCEPKTRGCCAHVFLAGWFGGHGWPARARCERASPGLCLSPSLPLSVSVAALSSSCTAPPCRRLPRALSALSVSAAGWLPCAAQSCPRGAAGAAPPPHTDDR